MTIKEAISKDPIQQKLRTNKALWNKACSALISRIIAFKKGINGRGDPKFGLPPSTIKDPLPSEIGAFLNQLANDFEQVVNGANKIMVEQEGYSKTRRKPQKEMVVAELDLSQLSATGSTRMSRLWTYLKSPLRFWDAYRRHKVSMLALCADIRLKILEFQGTLVSRDAESILNASKLFQTFRFKMKALQDMINVLEQTQNKLILDKKKKETLIEPEKTPEENVAPVMPATPSSEAPQNRLKELAKIKDDVGVAHRLNWPDKINDITKISEAIMDYKNNRKKYDYLTENKIYQEIVGSYYALLKKVLEHYNIAEPLNADGTSTLKDIARFVLSKKAQTANELVKTANNFITRWLKKKVHQLSPFDKTSSMRVQVFDKAESFKKELNVIMNMLEKSSGAVDLTEMHKKMNNLIDITDKIDKDLQVLNTMYMETYYSKLMEKGKDPFGPRMHRRLKDDLSKRFIG